jgi:hypothetical protein
MLTRSTCCLWIVVAIAGCAEAPPPATSPAAASVDATETPQLSPADLALVEKQKVCPVGGAELGSMGTPVKVRVKDRDVFLCCAGCKDALLEDPDTFLAKLDAASEAPPAPEAPAPPAPGS